MSSVTEGERNYINRSISSIAALKAVAISPRRGGSIVTVWEGGTLGLYKWDTNSTATGNDKDVVVPSGAPASGRWIRIAYGQANIIDSLLQYSFDPTFANDRDVVDKKYVDENRKFATGFVVGDAHYDPDALTDHEVITFSALTIPRNCIISNQDIATASPTKKRLFYIADESSQGAATNNITVSLKNGGLINGLPNYVIRSNGDSIILLADGANGRIY